MHKTIHSINIYGINSSIVNIEIDIDEKSKYKDFFIIGLSTNQTSDTKRRIVTVLKNCGFEMPDHKITVNINSTAIKTQPKSFDLPIALGIMAACGEINIEEGFLADTIIIGELSLDGTINSIKGSLVIASDTEKLNKKRIIIPEQNIKEACFIENVEILGAKSIHEIISYFDKNKKLHTSKYKPQEYSNADNMDFMDVKGQNYAKRALQLTAAGKHNIIFSGPPGAGKTMLSKRLLTIMPSMTPKEITETTKIYSVSGKLNNNIINTRPFRSPHHTTPKAALIGGGMDLHTGELSLAHNGILFLDEVTEFDQECLEALREPLENKYINLSRRSQQVQYPANFILIAAYNPCPCGYFKDGTNRCKCSPIAISSYQRKLSGPILDRIDIQIGIKAIEYDEIKSKENDDTFCSKKLKEGVLNARKIQNKRFNSTEKYNSEMNSEEVKKYCILSASAEEIIKKAFIKLNLSMRAYHKTLKLARTIADLENSELIEDNHISEALMYKYEQK